MPTDRELDDLIDAALPSYSAAEPRPGLEHRILTPYAGRIPSRRGFTWAWAFAVPAAACLLVFLFFAGRHNSYRSTLEATATTAPVATAAIPGKRRQRDSFPSPRKRSDPTQGVDPAVNHSRNAAQGRRISFAVAPHRRRAGGDCAGPRPAADASADRYGGSRNQSNSHRRAANQTDRPFGRFVRLSCHRIIPQSPTTLRRHRAQIHQARSTFTADRSSRRDHQCPVAVVANSVEALQSRFRRERGRPGWTRHQQPQLFDDSRHHQPERPQPDPQRQSRSDPRQHWRKRRIGKGKGDIAYIDVGVNIDCRFVQEIDQKLAMKIKAEISSIPTGTDLNSGLDP